MPTTAAADRGSDAAIRHQIPTPHPDAAIGALAARQHGVVAFRQLLAAGASTSMIHRRVLSGHLIRLHRGVYAVGHERLRREGHWLAAVLAVGPGAVLSHRHAAALHGIRSVAASRIDVSTPADRRATFGPIRVYGRRALHPDEIASIDGIPVTTVARTLLDLAGLVGPRQLERAVSESERLGLFDLTALEAALKRARGRPGSSRATLMKALTDYRAHGEIVTRSELEVRFLALLDDRGLPRPVMNAIVGPYEVDAFWPQQRLVVELDGWTFHRDRHAFERDREKANDLTVAGYTVLRFTYRAVIERPSDVAARITRASESAPPLRRSARRAR
jgi:predicted transcriptional regulator of viral defense system